MPPSPAAPPDLRRLTKADLPSAIASAARAFHDDPLFNFFQPDLLKQARQLPTMMRATVLDTLPHAETFGAFVDGRAKAVAGWLPPGAYPQSPARQVLFNLRAAPAIGRIPPRRIPPAVRLLTAIQKAHPKHEHWYLALLAVDPELQGRGVGGALLRQMLDRCDAAGLPAYLETQTAANVAWYGRHGFEVVRTIELPGVPGAPTRWALARPPKA